MANMGYVRFQNTLKDLQDCCDHIYDNDLSPEENVARYALLRKAWMLVNDFLDENHLLSKEAVEDIQALTNY